MVTTLTGVTENLSHDSVESLSMEEHKNCVELIGTYGSDEIHALSAWTSTSRDLPQEKRERIPQFIKMLVENGHDTPFEKSSLHFLMTTDIASHIHILRHRIGVSLNSASARYKELKEDKFYVPFDWDDEDRSAYEEFAKDCFKRYHASIDRLVSKGYDRKRAKESSRFYLPYGMQYAIDVMFNFRSFVHFLKLRYSRDSQEEVRAIARHMLQAVIDCGQFPHTLRAFDLVDVNGVIREPF